MAPASEWEQWVGRAEASLAPQHDPPHRPAGHTLDVGARVARHPAHGEAVPNTGGLAELVIRRLNAEPGEPPQGMVRRR